MSRGRSSGGSRGSSRSSSSRGMSRSSSIGSSRSRSYGGSYHHHHYYGGGITISGKAGVIFSAVILFILGISMLALGIGFVSSSAQYGTVKGVCVENEYVSGWYYTTYDYTVDGVDYRERSSEGWEFPEDEYEVVTLYYLKSDPTIITEEEQSNSMMGIILCLIGVGSIVGGVMLLKTMNKTTNQEEATVENVPASEPEQNTKITCPYCGTKYSNIRTSCPNCGSSKH